MLPTGGTTGKRNSKLVYKLNFWNEQHELGIVFDSSTGFILPNGAMRSPDASWVRLERWDALTAAQQEKFPPLCPDFVAELLSPSDNLAQAQQKMTEWMENGCRLGWLLHPTEKLSWVYEAGKPVKKVGGLDQTLSGGRVLPGFEFDLQLIK
jgi:Uma2 family endonuclease